MPQEPLTPTPAVAELLAVLRTSITELEAGRARRRAALEPVQASWQGGRRSAFDAASEHVDVLTRRAIAELEALRAHTLRLAGGR
jgi:hypothetical protein